MAMLLFICIIYHTISLSVVIILGTVLLILLLNSFIVWFVAGGWKFAYFKISKCDYLHTNNDNGNIKIINL